MTDRLDQGDLDAALSRVTLFPTIFETVDADCACGHTVNDVSSAVNLLELVEAVAKHQRTCPKARA